jgi:hypothetical protein
MSTALPHSSVTSHQQPPPPPPRRAREKSHFLISCRYQQKYPTVRPAQPLSLRQVMPGPYSTEHSAYEFNCRAKIPTMFCTTFCTTCLFLFCWNIVCVCVCVCLPGTFVERPWHPLIGPAPKWKNKHKTIHPCRIWDTILSSTSTNL